MTPATSGEQWSLERGDDVLVIVEVGGGIRSWTRAGRPVLAGYAADELCSAGRGQQLIPWPNRIRDGRYAWDGVEHQLSLTEPKLGNASHGLVRWASWRLVGRDAESLTVAYTLHPQPGWDWTLELTTGYALTDDGLVVTVCATNVGVGEAPFGYGAHPYLSIGEADPAAVQVRIPAAQYLTVDDRLLPTGLAAVAGTEYDFRTAHPLGGTGLDTAYTEVTRDDDGRWRVIVAGDGMPFGGLTLWGDEAFDWVQVFTGRIAGPGEPGLAVEPMSCPPDAFTSGVGVVRLGPDQSWRGQWGISPG